MNNLGLLCVRLGHLDEARDKLTSALAMLKDTLPRDHPTRRGVSGISVCFQPVRAICRKR